MKTIKRIPETLLTALLLFSLIACTASTKLVKTWNAPDFKGKSFNKILVLAVIKDDPQRRRYEQVFAERINAFGVTGIAGHTLIDNHEDYGSKPKILDAVHKSGADAVLIATLVGVEKETRQIPSSFNYVPRFGYGYGYYGYSSRAQRTVHQPGHTTVDTIVKLETTVFDVATEKMVWAGGTRSFNPASADKVITENASLILGSMKKAGLLP